MIGGAPMRWIIEDSTADLERAHLATVADCDSAERFEIVEARNAAIREDLLNRLKPIVTEAGDLESALHRVHWLSITRVPC